MTSLLSLWIPILASTILVFLASAVIHMLLPYHRNDFDKIPDEDTALDKLRELNLPEGNYHFPHCSGPKEMGSPEYADKVKRGPVGLLTVIPSGPPSMGKELAQWFVYCLVVSIIAAYLASASLGLGTDYLKVFQVTGCSAFACYSLALLQNSIWYKVKWSTTLKSMFDGLVYALLTGGVFGWLWPSVPDIF